MALILIIGLSLASFFLLRRILLSRFSGSLDNQIIAVVSTEFEQEHPVVVMFVQNGDIMPEVVVLEPNVTVPVFGGYGLYPVRSLASVLLSDGQDVRFVQTALSHALGRSVDQVWLVHGSTWPLNLGQFQTAVHETSSALSWLQKEQWRWWLQSWDLEPDFSNERPDEARLAAWQPDLIRQCPVTLVNTTQQTGLGSQLSSLLENSGGFVIRVTDTSETQPRTQVLISPESVATCDSVVEVARSLFGAEVEVLEDAKQPALYRAEAVVMLGQDMADSLNREE